jgi:sterol desaturase/sphingolipid hydroxylase (fatty acid hydroxylase superfamily)
MADVAMLAAMLGFVLFLVQDALRPARRYAPVKRWRAKGVLFAVLAVVLNVTVPMAVVPLIGGASLLPGAALGTARGFAVGLLVSELAAYWVHRACHEVGFLWRWVHQVHHSAERFDTYGAFFFHPNEILMQIGLSLLVSGALLGLTPEAAGLVGAASFSMAWFQHANIRTPRALGWIVQRPENHGVHHARGVHTGNFGNLSIWDQVFGTFSNPAEAPGLAGFYDGSSRRMKEMLLGKDVSIGGLGRDFGSRGGLGAARAS